MQRKNKRPPAQMRAKTAVRKAKPSPAKRAPAKSSREKVRAYRQRMRAKGMRLVQLWVPAAEPVEQNSASRRLRRRTSATIRKAWAKALTPSPHGHAKTFEDIADLAGSVDGLPPDLSTNYKKYLRATGYGRDRSR